MERCGTNLWIAEVAQEIVSGFLESTVALPNVAPGGTPHPGSSPRRRERGTVMPDRDVMDNRAFLGYTIALG